MVIFGGSSPDEGPMNSTHILPLNSIEVQLAAAGAASDSGSSGIAGTSSAEALGEGVSWDQPATR